MYFEIETKKVDAIKLLKPDQYRYGTLWLPV